MKKLLYLLIFIISFLVFFVWTFPADKIVIYYLNKYDIQYESVEGNLFKLKIENLEYKQLLIPELLIKTSFLKINILIPENNKIVIDINRNIFLNLKDLELENLQKKPILFGNAKGNAKVSIKKYILADGNIDILIKKYQPYNIRNMKVHLKMKKSNEKTKLNIKINSPNINGVFIGYAKIPIRNVYEGIIEGDFEGKIFGSVSSQHIRIKVGNLIK